MLAVGSAAHAGGGANKDEAMAMVKSAVAFIKEQGADKAYPELTNKANAKFHDRDLYVVVYQLDGKVLAHGANEKFVGKDLIDAQDVDGKLYVKERVELAAKQPSFWNDYKFVNPVSKKVEPKEMYCEKLNTVSCTRTASVAVKCPKARAKSAYTSTQSATSRTRFAQMMVSSDTPKSANQSAFRYCESGPSL